jgi:hypothetical protein
MPSAVSEGYVSVLPNMIAIVFVSGLLKCIPVGSMPPSHACAISVYARCAIVVRAVCRSVIHVELAWICVGVSGVPSVG